MMLSGAYGATVLSDSFFKSCSLRLLFLSSYDGSFFAQFPTWWNSCKRIAGGHRMATLSVERVSWGRSRERYRRSPEACTKRVTPQVKRLACVSRSLILPGRPIDSGNL